MMSNAVDIGFNLLKSIASNEQLNSITYIFLELYSMVIWIKEISFVRREEHLR
jgi:hypothetical protein